MDEIFPGSITIGDRTVPLRVERKPVRNLNARLRAGTIHVSAPLHADREWIDGNLPSLVLTLLRRERDREVNRDGLALEAVRRVASRFHGLPPVDSVEFETGRTSVWGTFDPRTRSIRLAAVLRHMPRGVLESVVAHELCHTVRRHDDVPFRTLLGALDRDAERARGFLEGALWFARNGKAIPETDLGPFRDRGSRPFPSGGPGDTIPPSDVPGDCAPWTAGCGGTRGRNGAPGRFPMQKIVLALAALAALGASAAVAASAGIQVGDRAPWPEAKETIALPDYSPDSLDGRVVLVEIFRTW